MFLYIVTYSPASARLHGRIDKHAAYEYIRASGFRSRGLSSLQWRFSR